MNIEEVPYPNTEETITDRLTPKADLPRPGPPEWVSETYPRGTGSMISEVPLDDTEDTNIEVNVQTKPDKGLKARRFLELVSSGVAPTAAAYKLGGHQSRVGDFINSEELRDALKKLVTAGRLPAEVRKEMVRSGLNSLFLRNIQGKLKEQKIALEAAKQIAKDPEVGLVNAPVGPTVNINMEVLGQMLQNMKPIEGLDIDLAPEKPKDEQED